jgi:deoxyhypusine synthase
MKFEPLDFSKIRTYPLSERANKVALDDFAGVHAKGSSFRAFLDNLPRFLVANDFLTVARNVADAVKNGRAVIVMMGAHPIKCGLNPVLVDAMQRGIISAVALNGAGAIHDFETAYQGETSEDVQRGLDDGSFGMVDETSRLMNGALAAGVARGLGAGQTLGEFIREKQFAQRHLSILHTGAQNDIPVTVHIAIGTDIIHQHPTADGAVLGAATYRDFQRFASVVAKLDGGVVLNLGSTVIMPEVFLKALTIARNLGNRVQDFTAATFDMIRHYRPAENVVRRPTHLGGKGFYIVGHHELNIPLLFAAVTEFLNAD